MILPGRLVHHRVQVLALARPPNKLVSSDRNMTNKNVSVGGVGVHPSLGNSIVSTGVDERAVSGAYVNEEEELVEVVNAKMKGVVESGPSEPRYPPTYYLGCSMMTEEPLDKMVAEELMSNDTRLCCAGLRKARKFHILNHTRQ